MQVAHPWRYTLETTNPKGPLLLKIVHLFVRSLWNVITPKAGAAEKEYTMPETEPNAASQLAHASPGAQFMRFGNRRSPADNGSQP
jgi:hypothetical protein